jgi:hypothetical protein
MNPIIKPRMVKSSNGQSLEDGKVQGSRDTGVGQFAGAGNVALQANSTRSSLASNFSMSTNRSVTRSMTRSFVTLGETQERG